jgi:hypothetical protein
MDILFKQYRRATSNYNKNRSITLPGRSMYTRFFGTINSTQKHLWYVSCGISLFITLYSTQKQTGDIAHMLQSNVNHETL